MYAWRYFALKYHVPFTKKMYTICINTHFNTLWLLPKCNKIIRVTDFCNLWNYATEKLIEVFLIRPSHTKTKVYNVNPIFTLEWEKPLHVRNHTTIISNVTLEIVFDFLFYNILSKSPCTLETGLVLKDGKSFANWGILLSRILFQISVWL